VVQIRIHPSVLAADYVNMESELQRISTADAVHVDVMDNHFVPSLSFGPQMVKRIAQVSPVPLDVHLMINNADRHTATYAEMGAQSVTFHVEAATTPTAIISDLHDRGAKAGIALKPDTPVDDYLELFHLVDLILIMTVEPGAGGQAFLTPMMAKLDQLGAYLEQQNLSPLVQVDGGITIDTLHTALRHGANTFVAGSSVYGHGDPAHNIEALRASATQKGHTP
jgi:ribulose-phosphate 3-epimerase